MKKATAILLVLMMLLMSACTPEAVPSPEGESAPEGDPQTVLHPMLQNEDDMLAFLEQDELFLGSYADIQGEDLTYEGYRLHHIDINGDGYQDALFVFWQEDYRFLPAVCITVTEDSYSCIPSDFRVTPDAEFRLEDGFLLAEDRYGVRLAKYIGVAEGIGMLKRSFANYSVGENTEASDYLPGTSVRTESVMEKIDGLNHFRTTHSSFYTDENDTEHLITRSHTEYVFNEESNEFDVEYTEEAAEDLHQIMADHLEVGSESGLASFTEKLAEEDGLSGALAYYSANRALFSRECRLAYIADVLDWIREFDYARSALEYEGIEEETGYTVRIWGDNPVPEAARDIFKYVRTAYVEDGSTYEYRGIGAWYDTMVTVTCTDPEAARTIYSMEFDRYLLDGDFENRYYDQHDLYADFVYESAEVTFPDVYPVVYPAVVIGSPEQLREFEGTDLWKTTVLIVPQDVTYLPYADEDGPQ